jgi:hypothetical protein
MTRQLPSKPSIEQLRKQAKDIHKAHKKGDPSCCPVLRHIQRLKDKSEQEILAATIPLQEVQYAVSLEYGCQNWHALKALSQSKTQEGKLKLLQQSDSEIAAQTQPLIEGMHAGIDCNDYGKVTSSFSQEFRASFTPKEFQGARSYCYPLMGNFSKVRFCELHRGQDDIYVLWYITCEKQARPLLLSSKFIEEGGRVVIDEAHLLSSLE